MSKKDKYEPPPPSTRVRSRPNPRLAVLQSQRRALFVCQAAILRPLMLTGPCVHAQHSLASSPCSNARLKRQPDYIFIFCDASLYPKSSHTVILCCVDEVCMCVRVLKKGRCIKTHSLGSTREVRADQALRLPFMSAVNTNLMCHSTAPMKTKQLIST